MNGQYHTFFDHIRQDNNEFLYFLIGSDIAFQRLDTGLITIANQYGYPLSRSRLQKLIQKNCVYRDQSMILYELLKPSQKLFVGQTFFLHLKEESTEGLASNAVDFDIIYEDKDILVINKPAGLVVHPAPGHYTHTLVNGLIYYSQNNFSSQEERDFFLKNAPQNTESFYCQEDKEGHIRPGIVHRLDKDTSGLMVVAKNALSHQNLVQQLQNRTMGRRYKALVWGVPSPHKDIIETYTGRHPRKRQQMAVLPASSYSKQAITSYEVKEILGKKTLPISLVFFSLKTGRTHQIRLHCMHKGFPIVGDTVYHTKKNKTFLHSLYPEEIVSYPHQLLHAWELSLIHPKKNELMQWSIEAPENFLKIESQLRSMKND
jgi:23S rRNA pseudouridine1911/1915/1917 synthase